MTPCTVSAHPSGGPPLRLGTAGLRKLGILPAQSSTFQTVVPELMMEGRGLAVRPRETPPAGPGSAVPSPLQSSCRVCSCPGMEMDFAVLGGLQGEKKHHVSVWNRLNEHRAAVLLSLAHSDKIYYIVHRETQSLRQERTQSTIISV